ncbi:MAG: hypothetical protein ACTSSP_11265, partial [Candidatus Asgardarchaeia archaeon]
QIIGIEDGNDKYTKNILIKAKNPGIASIALAAPGFSSKEITLEIFYDKKKINIIFFIFCAFFQQKKQKNI